MVSCGGGCRTLVLSRGFDVAPGRGFWKAMAKTMDIANVRNESNVKPLALPASLTVLSHIPVVLSSRLSASSGSPIDILAHVFLA